MISNRVPIPNQAMDWTSQIIRANLASAVGTQALPRRSRGQTRRILRSKRKPHASSQPRCLKSLDRPQVLRNTARKLVTMDAPLSPLAENATLAPSREILGTHQKAFRINLDPSKYGCFAEIGAGQEVARWFFQVGGAAGTIAKTMSAYDMTVSDDIYGKARRYVSQQRLQAMLDHEYGLLTQRLSSPRGSRTRFFAFADTVAARSFQRQDDCHGWMGIRFQTEPLSLPSDIVIHIRLLDRENLQQQEALGIMGVNLIYGALYLHAQPEQLIVSLRDNLGEGRVEVDMIRFSGPDFARVDNRLMSLQLVQQGLTSAAMFTADGEVVQPAEVLYRKAILAERGTFRPVTKATVDLLRCALAQFQQEPLVREEECEVLLEMTLHNLQDGGAINHQDFLDRVDIIGTLGRTVLVSSFAQHYKLSAYLQRHTRKPVALAMGAPTLQEIFCEKHYADLEGGILEAFGRLFQNGLKLYVYPYKEEVSGEILSTENLRVAPHLKHLYAFLCENRHVESLRGCDENCLPFYAKRVLAKIRADDPTWEEMVPSQVARMIKARCLFHARGV